MIYPIDHFIFIDENGLEEWVKPSSKDVWYTPRVPTKRMGRKGTRKRWKRLNPPRKILLFLPNTGIEIEPMPNTTAFVNRNTFIFLIYGKTKEIRHE